MTRRMDDGAIEKEAQMQIAITAVKNTEYTAHTAAIIFGVSHHTFYARIKENTKPRNLAHEDNQNLTHAEEKELVQWITRLTITGYPLSYRTLREMAEEIRKWRVKNINDETMQSVTYNPIGNDWVRRYLLCHSELSSIRPKSIDATRVHGTSPERLKQ